MKKDAENLILGGNMPLKVKASKFKRVPRYLNNLKRTRFERILHRAGREGLKALSNATPKDTREASRSWNYEVKKTGDRYKVVYTNSVMADQTPLVILLQYGHGTGTGGYVSGRDFINPALEPVFQGLVKNLAAEVKAK